VITPFIMFSCGLASIIFSLLLLKKSLLEFGVFFCASTFFGITVAASFFANGKGFSISGGGLSEILVGRDIALPVSELFLMAGIFVTVGGLICRYFLSILESEKLTHVPVPVVLEKVGFTSNQLFKYSSLAFYLVYFAQIFSELISRNVYLFIEPGSALGTMRYISPLIGFLALGLLRYENSFLLFVLVFFSFFNETALNSRNASALMAGLILICFVRMKGFFWRYSLMLMGGITTYIFFLYLMFSRTNQNYGIAGLISQISPFLKDFASQSFTGSVPAVFGNFLSVIPITFLGMQIPTPDSYLTISFNPLFGRDVGWYDIGYLFYVNPWTPSGAVAQVAGLGFWMVFLTWFAVGFIFQLNGYLLGRVASSSFLKILSLALPVFATLQFLQYTLRSGMRYVYLWLVVGVLATIFRKLKSPSQASV